MTTLIVGGAGKTGRRVADRLVAQGREVRLASRSSSLRFDWEDRNTWKPALQKVEMAYVAYYPDLAFPGAAEAVGEFSKLTVANGVRRLVLLSGRGEEGARRAEQAVQSSGAEWTIVRASWFLQNFSEGYLLDGVRSGEIIFSACDVLEPFIDAGDIADIAAAALTDARHVGQLYDVTGPRLLSFGDAACEIAKAAGRDIRYVPVSREDYAAGMLAEGAPGEFVDSLMGMFAAVLDGRNSALTDGVERALGRRPRDIREWARETAATGVWSQLAANAV